MSPPNSAAQVPCKIDQPMTDYVVELDKTQKVYGPRVVRASGTTPVVCIVTCSDMYKLLKKDKEIAVATPVDAFLPDDDDDDDDDDDNDDNDTPPTNVNVCEVTEVQDKGGTDDMSVPEHSADVFERSKEHLSPEQQTRLASLLRDREDAFARDEFYLGNFTDIEHGSDTRDATPIKQRMRRTPACFAGEEEARLKKMIDSGVIQESVSKWASSPVLIRKRDGTVRWCIDYRGLNKVTVKDVFPLPLVDDCLDTIAGNVWFSKLDANSAYWQINIKPEDRHKTAFHTRYGLYEHVKMGFGLCSAPATYARVINLVTRHLNWKTLLVFLDDVLILEHLGNLGEALKRFKQFGLKLKAKKCIFFQPRVKFFGRLVSRQAFHDRRGHTGRSIMAFAYMF